MRNATLLGQGLALALLLAAWPAGRAAAPPPPGEEGDLKALERELRALRRDTASSFEAAHKTLDGLKERVAGLEKEVEALRKERDPRHSAKRAPDEEAGRIRLVNAYTEVVKV